MFVMPGLILESGYVQSLTCHCPQRTTGMCGISYRTGY